MRHLSCAAATAAIFLFAAPAAAQMMGAPTVDPPPPTAVDAMSNGIGERLAQVREEVRAAYVGGAIGRADADALGADLQRLENMLSYHLPRGYRERQRIRARIDAIEARLESARRSGSRAG